MSDSDSTTTAPTPVDLLISGCDVVCLDDTDRVLRDGAIAVDDSRIVWIGAASEAAQLYAPTNTLDGGGKIAMPGLIDGHVHTTQQLLRGRIAALARQRPLKIPIWRNYLIPFESLLDPEDVYLSGLVCYANMLMVGTTCFAEAGGPHPDEMGRAALDIGIRGFISLNTADQGSGIPASMMMTTDQALNENVALVERWQAQDQELVRAWLSLRQIMVCTPDLIREMAAAARELDTKIHTHLCEGTYEIDYALEQFGKRPPEFMANIDALDRYVHCAHSVVLTTEDIDLYSQHRPSACHCAFNNYHIGWPQLLVMWRRGIDIALGTDGAASWGPMDIYQVAHAARIGQQLVAGTPAHHRNVTTGEELIHVATNGGARALALGAEIGSLETGKKADIVLVTADDMDQVPVADPLFAVGNTVVGRDVQTVIVDGEVVMQDRELVRIDADEIRSQLSARMPALLARFEQAIA